ncbi:IS200/IS605 family element transposase accessory protein TnpB [Planktothrix sp. FACHB-1355]|uniref:IS200/IS605 family element transposase accessory protein TnpB n=1 Tax=Aerosakkonema funiforme FACHB-1375 TaxID=2949571 RepID=A0A926VH38_9CYAN|nr:IS200/IS605 family element transposase accessory protein TnpB [Aerosakkonema funiforme FACHB-1375]MBD3558091.1 IS200/IS605 family element transposase accessory protein TnpB [Planktothrix sp. FACHB-1355]
MYRAIKVRIYPTSEQSQKLSQVMGCARWWWNYALNLCNETYKETGKGLTQIALNKVLPKLKKAEDTAWLGECYSQVLQSTTLHLTKAFKNFFEKRAKYPRFKSYHGKQSCQYPQNCQILERGIKIPQVGIIKASIHRLFAGQLKTVTVTKASTGKYYASLLFDTSLETPEVVVTGKVIGIDLGLKDFCVTHDGNKTSKFANPRHIKKHEKNLARKQTKLARQKKGSKSREKARKLVAKVHERISNARQDFLHKLSKKIVNDNQVVVVENLNVKGMVRNHNLAQAIADVGWGTFINFLDYKLKLKGGLLVEIDRWFPSSKTCSNCLYQMSEMPLDIREWTCPSCGTHHDRDENAATNIRAEGIRQLSVLGTRTAAEGGEVSPSSGRKSVLRHSPVNSEAPSVYTVG